MPSDVSEAGEHEHLDDESLDMLLAQTLSEAGPHLRPRRKRNYAVEAGEVESPTPTPPPESAYLDQSVEYGYSSMGRRRKRRVIANNSADAQPAPPPKKSRPYSAVAAPPGGKKMPNSTPSKHDAAATAVEHRGERRGSVASNISKYAHARSFESTPGARRAEAGPKNRQQLIFQRKDGQQFSINVNQTLLIYSPTLPHDSKVMQISGRQAIEDPSRVDEMLKSDNFGPGATAMIVDNKQLNESTIARFVSHMNETARTEQKTRPDADKRPIPVKTPPPQSPAPAPVAVPTPTPAVTLPTIRPIARPCLQATAPRAMTSVLPKRFIQPTTRHSLIRHLIVTEAQVTQQPVLLVAPPINRC